MSMEYYRGMLIQSARMDAFRAHLLNVVRPGDRVLEIGAGLGTYSFFAAEAGAERVWAIEGAPVLSVAKAIARLNEFDDRIEFIRGWFPGAPVPGPVDVLIFEDYPPRLLDSWTYDMLRQLHRQVVGPNTRVIPGRAKMYVAPVISARSWTVVGPLSDGSDTAYGIDWSPSRQYITNTPLYMPIRAQDLQHEPQMIADVRLVPLPHANQLTGEASWTFESRRVIHGLCYWFEFEVGDGVWLSNAPEREPGSWGNLYLPLSDPWTMKPGEELRARVGPEATPDGTPGWLTWHLQTANREYRGHEFRSFPASLADMTQSSASWVPELSEQGQLEHMILKLVDGRRSVADIAREVAGTRPAVSVDEIQGLVMTTLAGRTKAIPSTTKS